MSEPAIKQRLLDALQYSGNVGLSALDARLLTDDLLFALAAASACDHHMRRSGFVYCGLCDKAFCTSCWPEHERFHYHNTPGYEALRRQ